MREVTHHKGKIDSEGNLQLYTEVSSNALYKIVPEPHNQAGQVKFDAPRYYEVYGQVRGAWENLVRLKFQRGPFKETLSATGEVRDLPPNGLTNEVLLAILIDRFENYQDPPTGISKFPSVENASILMHLHDALKLARKRTGDRMERGVEGNKQP